MVNRPPIAVACGSSSQRFVSKEKVIINSDDEEEGKRIGTTMVSLLRRPKKAESGSLATAKAIERRTNVIKRAC
jgi:hypothetical protein